MDGTNSVTPFRGARTHKTRSETAHSDYGDPCTKALFANQSLFPTGLYSRLWVYIEGVGHKAAGLMRFDRPNMDIQN